MRKLILIMVFISVLGACQEADDGPATAVANTDAVTQLETTEEPGSPGPTTEVETAPTPNPTAVPTDTPEPPTPTPVPAKALTVCMANEPESLYLYGDSSLAATAVRHALYENLYTTLSYDYQPQGLLKLPSLNDGDAIIREVSVQEGDLIVNPAGNVVPLLPGTQFVDAEGEFVIFERPGEDDPPLQMQQMVVDFAFHPLVWSDGTAMSADDSIFSFVMASDPETPGDKSKIERTESYRAIDDLVVQWTGLPGYLDPTYFTNVWTPLPRHQLDGFTAVDLLQPEDTTQTPLSTGPFVVADWQPGESLTLTSNPHYYRATESFPNVDQINLRFDVDVTDPVTAVTSGQCDVITQDGLGLTAVPTLQSAAEINAHFTPNRIFEHMDFGVDSWEDYGDDSPRGRLDWFEYVPVRQAIAQCINRQNLVDELFFGESQIMNAYIPHEHPLYPEDALTWAYDLAAANAALDEFGLEDTDGDGVREWVERDLQQTIVATTTFSITLSTNSESPLRLRTNEMIQADLAECGIQVNLQDVQASEWFDDGPFSPLFGRRFDLATFATFSSFVPACGLYLSTNITGPEEQGFGGWANVNATGWGSEDYDAACQAALDALPGSEEYVTNHQEALRIFSERLPSLPLFQYLTTAVTSPTMQNFHLNPTQPSELWNVHEWDIEQ